MYGLFRGHLTFTVSTFADFCLSSPSSSSLSSPFFSSSSDHSQLPSAARWSRPLEPGTRFTFNTDVTLEDLLNKEPGASNEPSEWILEQNGLTFSLDALWSEWSWITDPDLDHPEVTHLGSREMNWLPEAQQQLQRRFSMERSSRVTSYYRILTRDLFKRSINNRLCQWLDSYFVNSYLIFKK